MTVTAKNIIDRVRTQLIDIGSTKRWTDTELLNWLSDAQRAVVAVQADASNEVTSLPLQVGTRQRIPDDGNLLLGITRNMGADGNTPGRAIRLISREIIDSQNPDWHTELKRAVIYNYIFDPQDRVAFYVYPPSDGTGHIELNYSRVPADMTELADPIIVQDIYRTALFDYVMFRACQKDSDFAGGQAVAQTYFQSFVAFMNADTGTETTNNPNLQLAGFNPQAPGAAK